MKLKTNVLAFAGIVIFVLTQVLYSISQTVGGGVLNSSSSSSRRHNVKHNSSSKEKQSYVPATTEDYIMTHMEELGYTDEGKKNMWGSGCKIYESHQESNEEQYNNLHAFKDELKGYKKALDEFNATQTKDILQKIRHGNGEESQEDICKAARIHPNGIQALFPSNQLSLTKNGYVEPLLPPMRNPRFCDDTTKLALDIDYIIHDFEAMCLQLKPASKIILIDMGASLAFHSGGSQPVMTLMDRFEKFGLYFDQIFAFESTAQDPTKVYRDLLPEKYFSSYHWINTGVSADKSDKMNPFYSLISKFHEDDLVIVKLDIDTPAIEQPLFELLLEDESLHKLVDHFYFEHHIRLYEMRAWWGAAFKDIWKVSTLQESLDIMNGLRKKGISSHYWV